MYWICHCALRSDQEQQNHYQPLHHLVVTSPGTVNQINGHLEEGEEIVSDASYRL